jgi:HD-like signal output (HDOD) protein
VVISTVTHDSAQIARLTTLAGAIVGGQTILPPVPQLFVRLRRLVAEANPSVADIVDVIESDSTIADHLMRGVPAPGAFAAGGRATRLHDAVVESGPGQIFNVVQAFALRRFCDVRGENQRHLLSTIWKRSVARAVSMRALADVLDPVHALDADVAFQSGLMADVGAMALLWAVAQGQPPVLSTDAADVDAVLACVRDQHEQVGHELSKSWGFPPVVCATALRHHRETPPAGDVAWWNLFILGEELTRQLVAEADPTTSQRFDFRATDRAAADFQLPRIVLEKMLEQLKDELTALLGMPHWLAA